MTQSRARSAKARLASSLDGVEGWLALDEAWALHERARFSDEPLVVEIGAYVGRSAIAMALGMMERGDGKVVSIDPGDMEEGQYDRLLLNLKRAGVSDVVDPIRGYSHEARPSVREGTVGFLFIDGSHEYEDVLRDIDDWTPTLSDRAWVAFNDPFWPGVGRALTERVGKKGSPFRRASYVSQTVFAQYTPHAPWRISDSYRAWRLRAFVNLGRRWRDFHWRFVLRKGIPTWMKKLQLRAAILLFSVILPRHRP